MFKKRREIKLEQEDNFDAKASFADEFQEEGTNLFRIQNQRPHLLKSIYQVDQYKNTLFQKRAHEDANLLKWDVTL